MNEAKKNTTVIMMFWSNLTGIFRIGNSMICIVKETINPITTFVIVSKTLCFFDCDMAKIKIRLIVVVLVSDFLLVPIILDT